MEQERTEDSRRCQLQLIFLYYCSFGDRNNFQWLKQQNFKRLLIDSRVASRERQFVQFDIAFKKVSKSGTALNLLQFFNLLPELARLAYPKLSRKEAFKNFIGLNMERVYEDIKERTQFGQQITILARTRPDEHFFKIFLQVPALKKIHEIYMGGSRGSRKRLTESELYQQMVNLIKDFDLSPQLISKVTAYITFIYLRHHLKIPLSNKHQSLSSDLTPKKSQSPDPEIWEKSPSTMGAEIIQPKTRLTQTDGTEPKKLGSGLEGGNQKLASDSGQNLSLRGLIEWLIVISEITAKKTLTEGYSQGFKLLKLLEKMEASDGFLKVAQTLQMESAQTAVLISPQVRHALTSSSEQDIIQLSKINFRESLQSGQEIFPSQEQLLMFQKIFEELCSFGEVGNTKTLKSIKLKKLFDDSGLLHKLGSTWIDLKIGILNNTSQTGKVELAQFLEIGPACGIKNKDTSFYDSAEIQLSKTSCLFKLTFQNNWDITTPTGCSSTFNKNLQRLYFRFSSSHILETD